MKNLYSKCAVVAAGITGGLLGWLVPMTLLESLACAIPGALLFAVIGVVLDETLGERRYYV